MRTLLERIALAKEAAANLKNEAMDDQLTQRIAASKAIIDNLKSQLAMVDRSEQALTGLGVQIQIPSKVERAAALKTSAELVRLADEVTTRASDSHALLELLNGKASNDASIKASAVVLAATNRIYVSVDEFAGSLRPPDIGTTIPQVAGESSAGGKLTRAQQALTKPTTRLPTDSSVDLVDHITEAIDNLERHALNWTNLLPGLLEKAAALDPEVKQFLDGARSSDGAKLSQLTELVMEYLKSTESEDDFRIRSDG